MKFRSPTNEPIQVATIFGHVASVTHEWRELPTNLHAKALEAGCECDALSREANQQTNAPPPPSSLPDDRVRVVLAGIKRDPKPGELTASNVPNMNTLAKTLGHSVSRDDVMKIWAELEQAPAETGAV
jgi:hypothetical protein